MPPLLSVITVGKDDRAGLERTRASLLAQGFRDYEWLAADGGSADGSAACLAAWAGELAWWRSGPDGGPFAAMNLGLAQAEGDYLLFLNAGDTLCGPGVLARLAATLRAESPDLLYGDAVEDPGDGRLRTKPARHHRWSWYGMPAHHCAILYRRALVAGLRYPESLRVAGDYAFTLAALARARSVVRATLPVAVFAAGGISRREAGLGRREQAAVRRQVLGLPASVELGIRLAQRAMAGLRRHAPRLYARARFRAPCPTGSH